MCRTCDMIIAKIVESLEYLCYNIRIYVLILFYASYLLIKIAISGFITIP